MRPTKRWNKEKTRGAKHKEKNRWARSTRRTRDAWDGDGHQEKTVAGRMGGHAARTSSQQMLVSANLGGEIVTPRTL